MIKRLIILICLLSLVVVSSAFFILNHKIHAQLPVTQPVLITVNVGESLNRFSRQLKEKGWISSSFWVKAYARLYPEYANIKVGTYQVNQHDTVLSILTKIIEGQEHQFSVTLIEGHTLAEWLQTLNNNEMIMKTDHINSIEAINQRLNIKYENPEGLFYPDTYAFTAGTKDIDILKRAYTKMDSVLKEQWQNRMPDLPYKNRYEVLIMASIIEKETGKVYEQARISSVFINRLRKKMRLQTDPTVIYGLGERYQGDITRAHLKEKTAYNTYRINGLPPSPIAMPGLSAIKAAVNPEHSDYYYFVSRGNGEHQFSKNLSEHNAAVAKYQLGRN